MLNIKDDVDDKNFSIEASKNIGKSYYNEFVKPIIKEEKAKMVKVK